MKLDTRIIKSYNKIWASSLWREGIKTWINFSTITFFSKVYNFSKVRLTRVRVLILWYVLINMCMCCFVRLVFDDMFRRMCVWWGASLFGESMWAAIVVWYDDDDEMRWRRDDEWVVGWNGVGFWTTVSGCGSGSWFTSTGSTRWLSPHFMRPANAFSRSHIKNFSPPLSPSSAKVKLHNAN